MAHPFRFAVNLIAPQLGPDWAARCREAEELGYGVFVPDHLGRAAPFAALAAAASVTELAGLGTFVLNAAFWNPTLLAREVETVDGLSGGRLTLGVGTGYNRAEFEQAGLPWESPGARVDRVARLVDGLDAELGDRRPRLLLGGQGDRMLRLAAARADVVGFTGATLRPGSATGELDFVTAEVLAERVAFLGDAHERAAGLERNVLVQAVIVTDDREAAADTLRRELAQSLTVEELLELPMLLIGTEDEIVGQLEAHRGRFGFSSVVVLEPSMKALAPVVARLSGT